MTSEILRLAAFPVEGVGGNPAGVVLQASDLDDGQMQTIAAQVGFSETAFVTNQHGPSLRVRYFSPEMEVDFCGHATIAAGVALGEAQGPGRYLFETNTGRVTVVVTATDRGFQAELASNRAEITALEASDLDQILEILGWTHDDLAVDFTPLVVDAGNRHPILVLKSVETLQGLTYDFDTLQTLSRERRWPTLQLVAEAGVGVWQSRNPFAFGGVYEDPATGSAAIAFGVYLRELGRAKPGDEFVIKQGVAMGQPCLLRVSVGTHDCRVAGGAIHLP